MSDRKARVEQPSKPPPSPQTSRELIETIGELLVDPESSPQTIADHIGELQGLIQQHLERETDDGVFEETVFHAPWLTPLSESLRQQHQELLDRLGHLQVKVRQADGSKEWRRTVGAAFEDFVELFLEHDAGVQNLMQVQDGWILEPGL